MQIIRKSSLTPVPWKNGGGITHEVIRMPVTGNPFLWRVSIAQIDSPGPFSNFAGYRRVMVLLGGAGVSLKFDAGPDRQLLEVGDLAEFDGAVATHCELLRGPCTDLNLMVSESLTGARAGVERLWQPRPLRPPFSATVLVFPIAGSVSVQLDHGAAARLQAWDLAVLAPNEGGAIASATVDAVAAAPLVFFAALDDNSPEGAGLS